MSRLFASTSSVPRVTQRGFTLLEVVVVMGLSLVMMGVGTTYVVRHMDNLANTAAADHLQAVARAANQYAEDQADAIEATLASGSTASVSVSMLKAQGYLPASMSSENNFGQTYAIRFIKSATGRVEGIVVTQGGEAIKPLNRRKIAQATGAPGGHINEESLTDLEGAYGAWGRSLAEFGFAPGAAELAYALFVDDAAEQGGVGDAYLSRKAVPGAPHLNQMQANLDMADHDISNVRNVTAAGASVGALTVAGQSTLKGRVTMETDGDVGPTVERAGANRNASVGFKTTAGTVYAGQGGPRTFAIGGSPDLRATNSPWFEVDASGARVQGNDVFHTGNFDPASKADAVHDHDAGAITSGTLAAARIPTLDAGKIGSGVLSTSRIPNLSASKISSGTLNADRIPGLDASKITSGTLSLDRVPAIPSSKVTGLGTLLAAKADADHGHDASDITSGTFTAARIPTLDAGKIGSGVLAAARIPDLNASKITAGVLNAARIPELDAGKITSGTFSVDRLPAIPTSKVTGLLDLLNGKLNLSGGTMHGGLSVNAGPKPLTVYNQSTNHAYLQWFVESDSSIRSAWVGFGTGTNPTFTVANHRPGGGINLSPGAGGTAYVAGSEILHRGNFNPDSKANADHTHSGSDITSGTIPAARIPALPISKITGLQSALDAKANKHSLTNESGYFTVYSYGSFYGTGRMESWFNPRDKVFNFHGRDAGGSLVDIDLAVNFNPVWHAGNFNPASKADAAHTHSATHITSGTLSAARIPTLAISKVDGLQGALDATVKTSGTQTIAGDKTFSSYIRSSGNTGWINSSHGGGWYMSDSSWIRAYGNKGVYTPGEMRAGTLRSTGDATVDGRLTASTLLPTTTGTCNATCSPNGILGRTTQGAALSCVSGKWQGFSCGSGGGGLDPLPQVCMTCPPGYYPVGFACQSERSPELMPCPF